MKKGEFCWIHQHCHDIFSGKKYIRKDAYISHQEKCGQMPTGPKKIRLVKKKKKKEEADAGHLNVGGIECYLCSKRLKCPSSYTHHLSTCHYAEELMRYLKCQWTGDGQSRCWSCSRCDYSASNRWPIIAHLGSNRHNLLKEVASPEVWTSIPPPSRHVGGGGQVSKRIPGKLAMCKSCGFTSEDLAICVRCRRKMLGNVKILDDPSYKPKPDSTELMGTKKLRLARYSYTQEGEQK